MKNKAASIALLVVTLALSVVCYFFLPETVVTQLSVGGNLTTMSKLPAIGIPLLLGAGGSICALIAKEKANKKQLIISAVGIFVMLIMLAVNLIK